ncbi:hypothetical protein ZIOFF_062981 [Zingiber officinale]|uniref:Pectinesterase inhibitor domain-containing protein n=1 Tax=Zingiber officinale TaxID=94328 RepID=A0A8J5K9K0_ZINOF|nr:hypothetical protein ZIOFF_062981 [Zingiber officinale]
MPSFLDFNDLSKSNCIERAQRDKRLMIVVDSVSVILIVAIYTAATVVYNSNSTMGFQVFNTVQVLCSSTDNHTICESNLKDAVNSTFTPKDLLCATITVIVDEVGKAFQHSDAIESAVVKNAVEVCQNAGGGAQSELNAMSLQPEPLTKRLASMASPIGSKRTRCMPP